MMEYINSLTGWLELHPHLAGIITFFISLSESLAVVGLIVPGSVMMTTIGALIGSGVLPVWETIIWAILGAVAGDSASYWLGHHYHEQLKRFWPFSTHPHWLERGETFFLKHGGKSIFIARFAGPMRPIVPVVAGMLNMQPRRFLLANIISAIAWAPTYMIPGILLGFASLELAPETLTRFIFILLGGLLAIWLGAWILQHLGSIVWRRISNALDRLWVRWAHTRFLRLVTVLLRNPHYKEGHGQLTLGLFLAFTMGVFVWFGYSIEQHGLATHFNQSVWHFFRGLKHPLLDNLILSITYLGEKKVLLPVVAVVFAWLMWQRYWRTAWHWLGLAIFTAGSISLIKHLMGFPRPGGLLMRITENSFPSGHTTLTVALYGFLAVLFAQGLSRTARKWIVYAVSSVAILVMISRLYLGAHWLSDIIAGVLLGLICLMLGTLSYHRQKVPKIPGLKLFAIAAASLVLSASLYFFMHHQRDQTNYQLAWQTQTLAFNGWWQQKNSPVIYRVDRFNEPDEVLQIQWASNLMPVEKKLEAQGWYKVPKTNLNEIINRIAAKDRRQQLPILSNLYNDRSPALVMVKKTEHEDLLVVLRLWHSGYALTQPDRPLWYGSVSYNKLWHRGLFRKKRTANANPTRLALDILLQDIEQTFGYKWINYSYPNELSMLASNTNDKRVLLVKD